MLAVLLRRQSDTTAATIAPGTGRLQAFFLSFPCFLPVCLPPSLHLFLPPSLSFFLPSFLLSLTSFLPPSLPHSISLHLPPFLPSIFFATSKPPPRLDLARLALAEGSRPRDSRLARVTTVYSNNHRRQTNRRCSSSSLLLPFPSSPSLTHSPTLSCPCPFLIVNSGTSSYLAA